MLSQQQLVKKIYKELKHTSRVRPFDSTHTEFYEWKNGYESALWYVLSLIEKKSD